MGLPTLTKTYNTANRALNHSVATSGTLLTDCQAMMFWIVSQLIAWGVNAWNVLGSSDGAGSFSVAGTNYWAAPANLIWSGNGSNHSWIWLNSQMGQVVIDLNSYSPNQCSIFFSPHAGFTGGSATTRPTATDEIPLFTQGGAGSASPATWMNGTPTNTVISMWHSTDDKVLNVLFFQANVHIGWWHLEVPAVVRVSSGWTYPWIGWAYYSGSGVSTEVGWFNNSNANFSVGGTTTRYNAYLTVEAVNGTPIGDQQTYANDLDGSWPLATVGMFCMTAGARGSHCALTDLWWGSSTPTIGDSYPGDGSKQFMQFGRFVFPWDGSTAVTA